MLELKLYSFDTWKEKVAPDLCENLYASMRKRMDTVNKGCEILHRILMLVAEAFCDQILSRILTDFYFCQKNF